MTQTNPFDSPDKKQEDVLRELGEEPKIIGGMIKILSFLNLKDIFTKKYWKNKWGRKR